MSSTRGSSGALTGMSVVKLALMAKQARAQVGMLTRADPIAIIGMGCRFPGGVDSPATYWSLLRDGVDAVGEMPGNRWDVDGFYDADPATPGKTSAKHGGFIDRVDAFDAGFFRHPSPRGGTDGSAASSIPRGCSRGTRPCWLAARAAGGICDRRLHRQLLQRLHAVAVLGPRLDRRAHVDRNAAQRSREPVVVSARSPRSEHLHRHRLLVVARGGASRLPEPAHGGERGRPRRRRLAHAGAGDDDHAFEGRVHVADGADAGPSTRWPTGSSAARDAAW